MADIVLTDWSHVAFNTADDQTKVARKTLNDGSEAVEPERSRAPIRSVIEKTAIESVNSVEDLNIRVDRDLKNVQVYSSVFQRASKLINDALQTRAQDISKANASAATAHKLNSNPATEYVSSSVGESRYVDAVPGFRWTDSSGSWVYSTQRWPGFKAIDTKIVNCAAKSVSSDIAGVFNDVVGSSDLNETDSAVYTHTGNRAGYTDVRIVDQFSRLLVEGQLDAGFSPDNTSVRLSNDVYIDTATGKPKNTMPIDGSGYEYDYGGRPKLTIHLPRGLAGSDDDNIGFRPYMSELWNNGNVAAGITNHWLNIPTEPGNGNAMLGAFVTFQKCAMRRMDGNSESGAASIYAPGTNTRIINENWDWDMQTTIFLPYGSKATAHIEDSEGRHYYNDVIWGCFPYVDGVYSSLESADVIVRAGSQMTLPTGWTSYLFYTSYTWTQISSSQYNPNQTQRLTLYTFYRGVMPFNVTPGGLVLSGGKYMTKKLDKKYGYSLEKKNYDFVGYTQPSSHCNNRRGGPHYAVINTYNGSEYISTLNYGEDKQSINDTVSRYFMVPVKVVGLFSKYKD